MFGGCFFFFFSSIVEQIKQLETDPEAINFLAWSETQIDDPSDFLCEFCFVAQFPLVEMELESERKYTRASSETD